MGLVFSISNFFITKTPLANNWRRKKMPSCSYSALVHSAAFSSYCWEHDVYINYSEVDARISASEKDLTVAYNAQQ